jgi:hypothetical protein
MLGVKRSRSSPCSTQRLKQLRGTRPREPRLSTTKESQTQKKSLTPNWLVMERHNLPMNPPDPSPRQIAGRLNRSLRKPLTAQTRQALRTAALLNRPWTHSTGPRSAAGRAQSAINGKRRQKGEYSVREMRRQMTDVTNQANLLRQLRNAALQIRLAGNASADPNDHAIANGP